MKDLLSDFLPLWRYLVIQLLTPKNYKSQTKRRLRKKSQEDYRNIKINIKTNIDMPLLFERSTAAANYVWT